MKEAGIKMKTAGLTVRRLRILSALIMTLSGPSENHANLQEDPAMPGGSRMQNEEVMASMPEPQLYGKIVNVAVTQQARQVIFLDRSNPESRHPAVQEPMAQVPILLEATTNISDGVNVLRFSDLKVGQHVRIVYTHTWGGPRTARAVLVEYIC